ncbi:hypothetical protein C0J52_11186 [Blattella germanica]|nr:hypothetical protein C0J52_11186 [Blattella germanica]
MQTRCKMQGVVKVSFIVVCLLLTLHSTRSASNETARQQVSTDTPELWTALGCFVNENNITICNQRVGEQSKKRKKKKSSGLMKLMMLGMFLKSKLSTFMMIFGTILQLKFFGIAVLNLVVGLVRLIVELSKKKESQKIIYYEQAHHEHEHVYDQKTEDDKGWLSGWLSKQDQPTAQELAYKAYAPHS